MKCLVITLALVFILVPTTVNADEFDDLVNETIDEILKDEVTLEDIIEFNELYIGSVTGPTDFSKKGENQKLGIYLNLFGYNPRINISGTHYVPETIDYENDLRYNFGAYKRTSDITYDGYNVLEETITVGDDMVSVEMIIEAFAHKWVVTYYEYGNISIPFWSEKKYYYVGILKDTVEKPKGFSDTVNVTMVEHQNAVEISVNGTDIGSIEIYSFGPSGIFNQTNVSGNVIVTLNSDTFLKKKDERGMIYGEAFDVPPVASYKNTLITYLDGVFYVPKEVNIEMVIVRSPDGTQKEMNIERIQVSSNNPENGWKIVLLVLIFIWIIGTVILKLGGE